MFENHPQLSILIERTGWLLIHSLWQFVVWALIALVVLKCLRRASATARYVSLVSILLLVTLTPIVTWWFLPDVPQSLTQNEPGVTEELTPLEEVPINSLPPAERGRLLDISTGLDADSSSRVTANTDTTADTNHELSSHNESVRGTSWSKAIQQMLEPWLGWIVGLWFTGMLICSLRPLAGWTTMRRLSRHGISDVPENIGRMLRETAERLGIRQAVNIFQSSLVRVPLVVGFLRPVILLPASVVTGFSPAQLQAILAHELAHIRRYDQLVNLWQTLAETVFFYHPLVWWLSHQIRCERENCCDDLAVKVTGGKAEYGRALLALDELRGTSSALALSSHGGSLSTRIRRLVAGEPSSQRVGLLGVVAFLILLTGIASFFLFWNPNVPSLVSLEANSKSQAETAMSAEEQAAWDALDGMHVTVYGDAANRRHLKNHLKNLEEGSFPEDHLDKLRAQVNRPVHDADFWDVPPEAWPQIAKLQSLRELSLIGTDVRGEPMEIIGQLKHLRHFSKINGECFPGDLVHLKNLPELESVEIMLSVFGKHRDEWIEQRGDLTADEQQKLAELVSQVPPERQSNYREVVVTALFTDRAIRELRGLENLRSFKLINTYVTGDSIQYLSQLPRLEEIELSVVGFTREDAQALGQVSTLRSFSQADADNEILQELSTLSNLEKLEVWADGVTSAGVPHLLKLQNLRRLEIRGNHLDDAGLIQLAQLPKLEYLDITHTDGELTLAGVIAFQEKKPDCRLEVDDDLPLVPAEEAEPKEKSEDVQQNIPALERKVSLKAAGMPLRDALQNVARQADVEIVFDESYLEQAQLDLDRPLDADFENLLLGEALGELIDWQAHRGVMRDVRGDKLVLTTLAAEQKRVQQHIPDWLKPMLGNGMVARLDDDNEVEELYFGNQLTDELLVKLTSLPRLRKLDIEVTGRLTDVGIRHLAELKNVQTLNLYGRLDDELPGDEILGHLTGLEQLRELSIGQCGITDEGLKHLELIPQLTHLRLNGEGRLTDDCLASIAKLKNLRTLSIASYGGTVRYGRMLFGSEALEQLALLRQLESLDLTGQPFPAGSFVLTNLKSLSVSGDQVNDEFASKLARRRPQLSALNLWKTKITDAGLKQIAELPELRKLSLFDTPITDDGLRALQNSPHLEHLELRNLKITDTGIGHVGKINTLTRLDFHACTQTTVAGLDQLKTLPKLRTLYLTNFPDQTGYRILNQLKHLRELSFMMCEVSYEDWKWLKTAMPRTQIHHATGGGGFSMWEPSPPEAKVKLPGLPAELQPQEEQQPTIPFKQPVPGPEEEEEEVIPPRPRDQADIDAPLRLQVSRKNPPDWVISNRNSLNWSPLIVGFLPDNTLLGVGSDRSQLKILDPKDGTTIRNIPLGDRTIQSLKISHDRRHVVCVTQPPVNDARLGIPLINATSEVREFPSFELIGKPIVHDWMWSGSRVAISAKGDFLAVADENGIFVWNVETGQQFKQTPILHDSVGALAFSPDSRWLVNSSLGDLSFWQWQTDEPPQTIHVGRHTWSLAFSPDSRYLFEGPDSRRDIQVRDLKTMEVMRRLKDDTGHSMSVSNFQFTDQGKTLVAGNAIGYNWQKLIVNDRLHFWDIETGKILRKFDFTRHEVAGVFVSPNGRYLVVVIYDLSEVLIAGWDLKKTAGTPDKP